MLEMGRLGFVSVFQNETYGDIHIELKKPIERNILERVQEFDSSNADQVAASIIGEAMIEQEITGQESAQVHLGEMLATGHDSGHESAIFENVEAILDDRDGLEGSSVEHNLEAVTAGALAGARESASDDELLMAEKELGLIDQVEIDQGEGDANV
jgi:hypothetical protein